MPTVAGGKRTNTRAQHRQREEFKAECKKANARCWLCGMDIDYDAPYDDWHNDDRFQEDHYYPVADYPELQDDPTNKRPSHAGCNRDRSNKAPVAGLGTLSREWF